MNQLGTVYATKRRRRNGKSLKPTPKDGVTKSNPSKRHRERLNAELDTLASLLPFEQNILSKLDRLSILRLSVSYLRTKSYFQVVMHKDKDDGMHRTRDLTAFDHTLLDGEMFLQALNGFLMILTCEGEVFFATHSIEGYLGFHQSDIVHQSVYELVHSEDREELQRQLMWNSFLPPESANMGLQDVLLPDNCHLLERSFTVRFRCLLDNTSGFLRLDIRGRVKVLHGQNRKSEEPPLALFAICTPFGPPSLLEIPQKEVMFKSKHKLDLALVSMDQRGKMLLGYSDAELANMGGYDLVHYDDLAYVASAHQELLKTGASGMIAYRFQTKEGQWQWLQTSSRLVYKNSKPDFVISTHRPLMEEEGRDLLGKRTMDFKVSYLDAGLPNSYFTESEQLMTNTPPVTPHAMPSTPARVNRRYKTQLRDFLSTCRTKRKLAHGGTNTNNNQVTTTAVATPPVMNTTMPTVDYIAADGCTAAAAAYNMYTTPYPPPPAATDHTLSSYISHSNYQHGLYPTPTALDNRYLTTTENLFHQYRPLGTYYPEYHHSTTTPYVGNGFLDMPGRATSCTMPTYDPSAANYQLSSRTAVMPVDEKLYSCQQVVDTTTTSKYPTYVDSSRGYVVANKCLDVSWPYSVSPSSGIIQPVQVMSAAQLEMSQHKICSGKIPNKHPSSIDGMSSTHSEVSSPVNSGILTPKMEEIQTGSPNSHHLAMNQQNSVPPPHHFSPVTTTAASAQEVTRQTVLMWGSGGSNHLQQVQVTQQQQQQQQVQPNPQLIVSGSNSSTSRSPPSNPATPTVTGHYTAQVSGPCDPLKSLAEMNNSPGGDMCKWTGSVVEAVKSEQAVTPATVAGSQPGSPSLGGQHPHSHTHQSSRVVMVL